jgi:arylsulfatase
MVSIGDEITKLMKTYLSDPPRKLQSQSYSGPITITDYQRLQSVRETLKNEGINLPLPTGN